VLLAELLTMIIFFVILTHFKYLITSLFFLPFSLVSVLRKVEAEEPVEDMILEQPHLEFDLTGMDQEELAKTYREQVNDLFALGSDVVGRQIDYADVETIIGKFFFLYITIKELDLFEKKVLCDCC
jgi:hypothetical protein